jgi:hypothetical protein
MRRLRQTFVVTIPLLLVLVSTLSAVAAQQPTPAAPPSPQQETAKQVPLSPAEISQLQTKAQAGDAGAQFQLGKAYETGDGIPPDDTQAAAWYRKAAEQGNPAAENDLGRMYGTGRGVPKDEEEAVRWYHKAAKHGNPQAMFNLGVSYYNGEGVGTNEFTAYAWFLLARHAGDTAAEEAVNRSAATMSKGETAAAFMRIADMYEKGEELPKDEGESVHWLRKAAEIDSAGKVRLADHLLQGPDVEQNYAQALELCKAAAKDYGVAICCVGDIYRKGLGVRKNPVEAAKWYRRAVANSDSAAMVTLAEMYSTGEGMKVDRPVAFLLLFRASQNRLTGAAQKASEVLQQMDKHELKQVERKLEEQRLDPKKVFAALQAGNFH